MVWRCCALADICPQLAIISPEVWNAVQARFARRKSVGRRPGNGKHHNVLTGVLKCEREHAC